MEIYSSKRGVYTCFVKNARKDNPVVKKGESYYWVRKDKFSNKEYFKTVDELNDAYPIKYVVSSKQLHLLLSEYKIQLSINRELSPNQFFESLKLDI